MRSYRDATSPAAAPARVFRHLVDVRVLDAPQSV
jgi:hypothetical protein